MVDREQYLYHLTLTTGHARKSYRSEISDKALAACADLIERLNAHPLTPVPMPVIQGYSIIGDLSGPCGVVQIFAVGKEQPLVTIGIATRERCGVTPWQLLGGIGPQPRAPWLAVKIEEDIAYELAMYWLGDFERCLGWAFIDRLKSRICECGCYESDHDENGGCTTKYQDCRCKKFLELKRPAVNPFTTVEHYLRDRKGPWTGD